MGHNCPRYIHRLPTHIRAGLIVGYADDPREALGREERRQGGRAELLAIPFAKARDQAAADLQGVGKDEAGPLHPTPDALILDAAPAAASAKESSAQRRPGG